MEKRKITTNSFITSMDNKPLFLDIDSKTKLEITVNENISSKLIIVGNCDYDINIKLLKGSSLLVNSINKDNSVNVNVLLNENSVITYNHSILATTDSINSFNINHLSSFSSSIINNNGINNNDNKLFFTINGIIPKNLKDIICNQSSKIMNFKNGNSKIIPNLIIDSNDIVANHSAYIGEINEEELFYMKSRGISSKEIQKLIYKATLLGKMELQEEKEEFNKIINEWW